MSEKQLIFSNEGIDVYKNTEYLELNYKTPHTIRIKLTDRQEIDNEVVRMLKMKTENRKKYFVQREVGKIIGVSRQMVNRRWQVYKQEGLLALLTGEWEKSKITESFLTRLGELCVENPFLSAENLIENLQQEGLCEQISITSVYNAQKQLDGRKLIELMREKANKKIPEAFMESGYMIERLFKIVEELLTKIPKDKIQKIELQKIKYLKSYFIKASGNKKGPTEKDKYKKRKKLERDKRRNIGFIRELFRRISGFIKCPDCHSSNIGYIFKRKRGYKDKHGRQISDYSEIYRCYNHLCITKYFTVPPKGVELYARVHKAVKKMVLRWFFHLRGSLSRVCDELKEHRIKAALTTVLRWIKKAGEECVPMHKLFNKEDWSQPLCIDEKWIKVRKKWLYVFTAVGTKVTDLLGIELFLHKDKSAMKTFLLKLKSLGFNPKGITTDLLMGYESVVKEIFPDCIYNQCVLHAERDAKRIVRKALADDGNNEGWKNRLTKRIRTLFKSKKIKQAKKRYYKIMKLKEKAPEAVWSVFDMLVRYYPKFLISVMNNDIPKTTNPVERAIGEFAERYQLTKGFTSFYFGQFFLRVFEIYYRLRKISFGRFRGKNRLELKGNPLGSLNFTEYLTPTIH